jgi:hypothetical protein
MEVVMQKNLGLGDRAFRLCLGLFFGTLAYLMPTLGPQITVGTVASAFFATALIGYCPLYGYVGMNTLPETPRLAGSPEQTPRKVA